MTPVSRRSVVPRAARFERPRTQLLTQLSETVDVPLIVLAAPSGYGKTTLLAQYARVTPRRVAWCRLTDTREGPATITARLAAGLPELAALAEPDPRTPAGALLDQLASALSALNDGVDLVVDNVQTPLQSEWLSRLADTLEEGHRLLLGTYSTEGLRVARRLAEGRVHVLDTADLAFTPQETHAYLQERGGHVPADDLAHLGGWRPSAPPDQTEAYVLRLVTLGDCRANINGQPLKLGLAKARELLVWLALHGSGSRDKVVTALWDGSAEERHIEYFRVAVRRLRGALRVHLPGGLDPLPYVDGRYRLDDTLTVYVDVHDVVTPGALKPFLPGIDTEWAQTYRLAQAQRAASTLLGEAAALPPAQAANQYRVLLRLDPLLGAAHEGLILTLQVQGDVGQARQALQVYRQVLQEEYGSDVLRSFLDQLHTVSAAS